MESSGIVTYPSDSSGDEMERKKTWSSNRAEPRCDGPQIVYHLHSKNPEEAKRLYQRLLQNREERRLEREKRMKEWEEVERRMYDKIEEGWREKRRRQHEEERREAEERERKEKERMEKERRDRIARILKEEEEAKACKERKEEMERREEEIKKMEREVKRREEEERRRADKIEKERRREEEEKRKAEERAEKEKEKMEDEKRNVVRRELKEEEVAKGNRERKEEVKRRLEREKTGKEVNEREEDDRSRADKKDEEGQERRRRREKEKKKVAEERAKEENERMEEEKRNKSERRLKEEEAKANKKKKEEMERREEEIDRREREIKRREEELEKKEKQTEKRLKEKEEEGRLKMEREWKEKEEERLKEANEYEGRRNKEINTREREMERREEKVDKQEEDLKKRVKEVYIKEEELEKMEKVIRERMVGTYENGLQMEEERKYVEKGRWREAKIEEERKRVYKWRKAVDLKEEEEKVQKELLEPIGRLEGNKAELKRSKDQLCRHTEQIEKYQEDIEEVLRKERMRMKEEMRRSVEEELEGKWRQRVEEAKLLWSKQNSELQGEWEYERVEWEREKSRNVKDMEGMRSKLVEAERLRMHLEEVNRRLKCEAEFQREEWNREMGENRRDWMEENDNLVVEKNDSGEVQIAKLRMMQSYNEEMEEERANLEREREELNRKKEEMKENVRQEIEDGLRKERMIVEEEVRRSVEGELNGKWKKRVEEVDSWWKTQNCELKVELENERAEWELEKARNVKEMEEMRSKLVEAESLSMQLEEKNRRLKSDAELQRKEWNRETEKNRRDWMEEKNNMTRKWEDKLKKDVDEAKKAERLKSEETMNILLQNYEREMKTLKEDVEMKEKGLYELQRKLDAISSKYEDEKYELNNKYQIEIVKLKKQNYDTKKVLKSKINEVDAKEKELGKQWKELNELQRWTVSEVRRLAGDRTEYYSQLASQQRAKHSDALDTRVVSYSYNVRQGISGDTCDSWNARQKAVEGNEEFIGELERKWIEYANQMIGKWGDYEKSKINSGKSNGNFFTNAISKTASFLSSATGDVSSEGSVEEHEDFTNPREVHDALNRNGVNVLSFSNGGGQDCEKYQMHDLSNHGEQLHGSKYDPLAGIKCSARAQGEEAMNTDEKVNMNVGCGDLCRDVVKKDVKSANHGKEDLEVAIGGITCESALVSGKKSHVRNDSDSSEDWLMVTERERDDKFNERVTEMNEKHDREIIELRKEIEKLKGEMMDMRNEMEVMRETNRQYQMQSNDQSSEVLTSNEGNVFREGGEELGGDELKDRKYRRTEKCCEKKRAQSILSL